jgi:hypothetical protein
MKTDRHFPTLPRWRFSMWLNSSLTLDRKHHPTEELHNMVWAPLGYPRSAFYALSTSLSCQPHSSSSGMPSRSANITTRSSQSVTMLVKWMVAGAPLQELNGMRLTRRTVLRPLSLSLSRFDWYSGAWLRPQRWSGRFHRRHAYHSRPYLECTG